MTWVWDAVFPQLFEEFYCVEWDLNSRILTVIYVRSVECNSPRSKWLRAQTLSQAAILKLNYHLDGRKKKKVTIQIIHYVLKCRMRALYKYHIFQAFQRKNNSGNP